MNNKKKNYKILPFILLALFFFYNITNSKSQISPNKFYNQYQKNTTQIDIVDSTMAYIYLNNNSDYSYSVNITNTDFIKKNSKLDIVYKNSKSQNSNSRSFFGIFDIIIIVLILLGLSRASKDSHTKCIMDAKHIKTKLKDVAGLDDAKKEIMEFVGFLKDREKYIKRGAKMPRGALLYGPPGTGKTLLAKAVAGECGIPFISTSGSDFTEMYIGVGASRVRSLFQRARDCAPCIIFIDEIDALARKRSGVSISGGSSEQDRTLNRLLVEMDGFEPNENIVVFGATNRLDVIDDALLRPGRFDRKIRFELPEKDDRKKIFNHYLGKMSLSNDSSELSEALSKQSFGFSAADIANICNEASILSVRYNSDNVTRKILENAIDNIVLGPEKKTFRLTKKEQKIVAYHESGHSVLSYLLKNTKPPIKVSIMPRGKSALGFSQSEVSENKLQNKDELFDRMSVLLGGRVAEEIFCGNITTGASDDIDKLTEIAYQYVSRLGMDKEISTFHFDVNKKDRYSDGMRVKIDSAVQKIIKKAYQQAVTVLKKNRDLVEKLTQKLLEKETLNQTDLDIIFNSK